MNIADLPFCWQWLKYVSFFRYGFEAHMINEFSGLELWGDKHHKVLP